MKKHSVQTRTRLWGALALSLLTMAPLTYVIAAPAATAAITASLQAFKVVPQKEGADKLAAADVAKPGDVIEYQATYSNDGKGAATNLNATLPIPAALAYVPNTAAPAGFTASTDAKTFAPAPLKRTVKDRDGKKGDRSGAVFRISRPALERETVGARPGLQSQRARQRAVGAGSQDLEVRNGIMTSCIR